MTWAIEADALTKRYPRFKAGLRKYYSPPDEFITAVDRIDLRVRKGELFGLLGPNSAGKTTFIKLLSTLITPTSGSYRVNGYSLPQPCVSNT